MWSKVRACTMVAALVASIGMVEAAFAQEPIKPFNRRIVGGEKTDIRQHPVAGRAAVQRQILLWRFDYRPAMGSDCRALLPGRRARGGLACESRGHQPRDRRGLGRGRARYRAREYNPLTYENDIALIKLKLPAAGRVIALVDASATMQVGQPLEVTGWGATEEGGGGSNDLLKASVPYADTAVCNAPASYNGGVRPSMMCAGYSEGGVDSCQGDSGGPLVWRTPDGPVLVGVVSFGDGCARKLKYGVYTRVSAYRDWIDRAIAADDEAGGTWRSAAQCHLKTKHRALWARACDGARALA